MKDRAECRPSFKHIAARGTKASEATIDITGRAAATQLLPLFTLRKPSYARFTP